MDSNICTCQCYPTSKNLFTWNLCRQRETGRVYDSDRWRERITKTYAVRVSCWWMIIYIYIYIRDTINKFSDFFVQPNKIVFDSWKCSVLLLYIVWDDLPIFMISDSNEQIQQELEYTLLKPDFHCWWISKM